MAHTTQPSLMLRWDGSSHNTVTTNSLIESTRNRADGCRMRREKRFVCFLFCDLKKSMFQSWKYAIRGATSDCSFSGMDAATWSDPHTSSKSTSKSHTNSYKSRFASNRWIHPHLCYTKKWSCWQAKNIFCNYFKQNVNCKQKCGAISNLTWWWLLRKSQIIAMATSLSGNHKSVIPVKMLCQSIKFWNILH